MEQHSILIYILLAIVITNLIRVIPMAFIKGPITNRFVRSFLYYVPYVTLAVAGNLMNGNPLRKNRRFPGPIRNNPFDSPPKVPIFALCLKN